MSASASAVVAPPAFSMKFACFGEIQAPPIAEPGGTRAMKADRVRRSRAGANDLVVGLDVRELATEFQDERVDAAISGEKIRAETDDGDGEAPRRRPLQELADLVPRLRPRER